MTAHTQFPAPIRFGGRLRFDHHEHENYKRALAGLPAVERGEGESIRFVDASAVCADLAIDRRTLGRRVRGHIRGEAAHTPSDSAQLRPQQRPAAS
jgi:hypothetical protein